MAKNRILYEKQDGVGTITLNRPEQLNAISWDMLMELHRIVEDVRTDDEVRAVIFTGTGKAFTAGTELTPSGADIPLTGEHEIRAVKQKTSTQHRESQWLFTTIPKPVICALNGVAVGIGAEFALQCDVRIAAESARWGEVFVLRGMVPDVGCGTYLLPRIVGLSKACELVFSGEIIDAQEMLEIGLVSSIVPDDQLTVAAREMAEKLTRGAPLAVQMTKQLMYLGLDRSMEDHQEATRYCLALSLKTQDCMEGIASFLQKREPEWKGM